MTALETAKAAFEEARTKYCFALTTGRRHGY